MRQRTVTYVKSDRKGKTVQCVTELKWLAFTQYRKERKIITRWDEVQYFKKHKKESYASS